MGRKVTTKPVQRAKLAPAPKDAPTLDDGPKTPRSPQPRANPPQKDGGRGTGSGSAGAQGTGGTPTPVPASLVIITQPSTSAISGTPLAQQIVVELRDSSGNPAQVAGRVINLSIYTGSGSLSGGVQATTIANGRATFSGTTINGPTEPDIFRLELTSPALAGAITDEILVSDGNPYLLNPQSFTVPAGSSSTSVNYTPAAGVNRVVVMFVGIGDTTNAMVSLGTAPTYNGTAMTLLGSATASTPNEVKGFMYYRINPPASASAVVLTKNNSNQTAVVTVGTVVNANQTTPFVAFTDNRGTTTEPVLSVTTSAGQLTIAAVAVGDQYDPTGDRIQVAENTDFSATTQEHDVTLNVQRTVATGSATPFNWTTESASFGLGPNAPGGLDTPFPAFLGDVFPAQASTYALLTTNDYGMGGSYTDTQVGYSLVSDPASPSGFALRHHFHGFDTDPVLCAAAYPPPTFGGGGAGRMFLRSGIRPQNWGTLYIRALRRYSANMSMFGITAASTLHDSGTATAGTSTTTIVDSTKSWTVNEHVGRCVRKGSASTGTRGIPIVSNTANTLTLQSGYRNDYSFVDESYIIYSLQDTGPDAYNTGIKGLTFPRIAGRLTYSNGAATPSSVDTIASLGDNHYIGGWTRDFGAGPEEGLHNQIVLQGARWWDGVSLSGGYPVWNSGRASGPPSNRIAAYTPGDVADEEYLMILNTPGTANGIFRSWLNGSLVRELTNVMYVEGYRSATDAGISIVIGGSVRDVALTVSEPRWDFMFQDHTYGGGLRVPMQTMSHDILAMIVAGT